MPQVLTDRGLQEAGAESVAILRSGTQKYSEDAVFTMLQNIAHQLTCLKSGTVVAGAAFGTSGAVITAV